MHMSAEDWEAKREIERYERLHGPTPIAVKQADGTIRIGNLENPDGLCQTHGTAQADGNGISAVICCQPLRQSPRGPTVRFAAVAPVGGLATQKNDSAGFPESARGHLVAAKEKPRLGRG
jgi:hypothetical protein